MASDYSPATKGGKIHQNLIKAHKMREDLDSFIDDWAARVKSKVRIFPMDDGYQKGNIDNSTEARKTKVGLTRILKNAHGRFMIEVRFSTDQLYLKMPSGLGSVQDGYEFFKDRYVLYIQMEGSEPSKFVIPFKIGDIPSFLDSSLDSCFWISNSESNSNRLNTSIYGRNLAWVPLAGGSGIFERKPSLLQALENVQ